MSIVRAAALNHPSASGGGVAISPTGNPTGLGVDLVVTQGFTASSTVNVDGCFTDAYDNYRVLFDLTAVSTTLTVNIRMRSGGASDTTSNYSRQTLYGNGGTAGASFVTGQTSWAPLATDTGSASYNRIFFDLLGPKQARVTTSTYDTFMVENAGLWYSMRGALWFNSATPFDGISFYPSTGTFSGTVRIYGYRN